MSEPRPTHGPPPSERSGGHQLPEPYDADPSPDAARSVDRQRPGGALRTILGLALVVPALVALAIGHLPPTIWTITSGFQKVNPLGSETRTFVGLDNYADMAERFLPSLGFTLSLAVLPLLTMLVVGPLLAYAAQAGGRLARWSVRIGVALPLACFAPAAMALAHRWSVDPQSQTLSDPTTAPMAVRIIMLLATFGVYAGVAVTVFLAVFARRADGRSRTPAAIVVGALLGLGALAVTLQTFTFPYVLTNGGPAMTTTPSQLLVYTTGFAQLNVGAAAAMQTVILLSSVVLGLAAAVVVIATGLRIEPVDTPVPTRPQAMQAEPNRVLPTVLTLVGLVIVLAVALWGLWPWLSQLGNEVPDQGASTITTSWLAQLGPALIGVLLAAVAGYGIGALRPLGRWSELLLLPFAPWLFVGAGPMVMAVFFSAEDRDQMGSGSPFWLVVPALFACTVLFRGLEARRRDRGTAALVLPALPAVGVASVVTWVVYVQDLHWALATDVERETSLGWLMATTNRSVPVGGADLPLAVVLPVPVLIVLLIVSAATHLGYLDRFAVRLADSTDSAQER